jgi:pimeloyl-ACP methyl ester carboxylesterase
MEVRFRTIDGLTIRFTESEMRDDHALLLSPWPESLLAYEQIWLTLAEHAHLVAVDLPGFGRSERREALLSPAAMGRFVIQIADEFGLTNPHALGPGDGASALLFAAATHPGRLRSLVVGGGSAVLPLNLGSVLDEWVNATDLDLLSIADTRQIVIDILSGLERYELPHEVREDYLSSYEGHRLAESVAYLQSLPTQLALLDERIPEIHTPVKIITGRRDSFVLPASAERLHERLPNSSLAVVDGGHFLWEDMPEEYARLVIDWWMSQR